PYSCFPFFLFHQISVPKPACRFLFRPDLTTSSIRRMEWSKPDTHKTDDAKQQGFRVSLLDWDPACHIREAAFGVSIRSDVPPTQSGDWKSGFCKALDGKS